MCSVFGLEFICSTLSTEMITSPFPVNSRHNVPSLLVIFVESVTLPSMNKGRKCPAVDLHTGARTLKIPRPLHLMLHRFRNLCTGPCARTVQPSQLQVHTVQICTYCACQNAHALQHVHMPIQVQKVSNKCTYVYTVQVPN